MVSIIIPTYNDTSEISKIINACKKLKFNKEIIVIDDGSEDEHKQNLKRIKGITLVIHDINKGKSSAMLTGVTHSKGNVIAFLDADIIGLTTNDIEKLIEPVRKGDYDITMSEKGSGLSRYGRYTGIAQAFTGERVFKRELIEENIDIFKSKGYTIESEMNIRFFNKVKIARVYWPNVKNPSKVRKGSINGIKDDIKMYNDIKNKIGIKELTRQLKIAVSLPIVNPEDCKNNGRISFNKDLKKIMTKKIEPTKLLTKLMD